MNVLRGSVKSKIVWLGLIATVLGAVQTQIDALQPFIPPKYFGLLGMVLGVAVIVARFYTSQSLEEKGAPTDATPQPPQP